MHIQYRSFCQQFVLCIVFYCCLPIHAQSVNEVRQVGIPLDQFALKLLAETNRNFSESMNLALSPYTIWTLLVTISEGAEGNTARELEDTLGIPPTQNRDSFRTLYQLLRKYLTRKDNPSVELDLTNLIFTSDDQRLKPNYVRLVRDVYDVDVLPINFKDTDSAANDINSRVSIATRGRIKKFVKPEDLVDAEVFVTSVLYFKGAWEMTFNKSATTRESFYDERGNVIGEVDMMFNSGPYPFSLVFDNKASAVELPYEGGNMSMIVLLPRKNVPLQTLLNVLASTPFSEVLDRLEKSVEDFADDPVQVYLPRFRTISDLSLNAVLNYMGIREVFDEKRANLLRMFYDYMYLSRVLQRAEIDVDEEGTVASSAAGATFQYKSPPVRFLANKPFVYVIYNKETRGIIFAGKISNPSTFSRG